MALRRLNSTERRLKKSPLLQERYTKSIEEYENGGYSVRREAENHTRRYRLLFTASSCCIRRKKHQIARRVWFCGKGSGNFIEGSAREGSIPVKRSDGITAMLSSVQERNSRRYLEDVFEDSTWSGRLQISQISLANKRRTETDHRRSKLCHIRPFLASYVIKRVVIQTCLKTRSVPRLRPRSLYGR